MTRLNSCYFPPRLSSINHLQRQISRTMQTSHNTNVPSSTGKPVEEVLRFALKLRVHSHPEQLLRALPAELSALLECRTAALIYQREGELDFHLAGGQDSSLSDNFSGNGWQQEIWSAASELE